MKNKLIVIGCVGSKYCYLNITKEEAIKRYKVSENDYDEDYLNEKINELEEFEFDDEFKAYDAWEK
jgi:hypothetical protein